MDSLSLLVAQAGNQTGQQIAEIHERIMDLPKWAYDLSMLLPVFLAVAVILIWQRQKRIAQNQVDLGNMLANLIEKMEK